MDREEIIRMAREAELIMETDCTTPWMEDHDLTPYLERFAALVAAAAKAEEREACAMQAWALVLGLTDQDTADIVLSAIRARGQA